jgi:hypothetical protein
MGKNMPASTQNRLPTSDNGRRDTIPSPEAQALLAQAASLLEENKIKEAMTLLARSNIESSWIQNALAVCQLRPGNAATAVNMLRGLVLGGLALRADAPTVFKANYAAALLAANNVAGGLAVLTEVRDEANPAVQKLRTAVARWKGTLTLWQKINWYLGGQPDVPLALDSPLGDL